MKNSYICMIDEFHCEVIERTVALGKMIIHFFDHQAAKKGDMLKTYYYKSQTYCSQGSNIFCFAALSLAFRRVIVI